MLWEDKKAKKKSNGIEYFNFFQFQKFKLSSISRNCTMYFFLKLNLK